MAHVMQRANQASMKKRSIYASTLADRTIPMASVIPTTVKYPWPEAEKERLKNARAGSLGVRARLLPLHTSPQGPGMLLQAEPAA